MKTIILDDNIEYIRIYGRQNGQRVFRYFKKKYLKDVDGLKGYKVILPESNNNGTFGETLVGPFVAEQDVATTQTFITIGFFKNKNAPLRFDFYLPKYNICIEYNGVQHYKKVEIFGGDKAFEEQKKRDKLKREYCKKNNIKLIEIAYNDNIKVSMDNILKVVNNDAYSRGNY